MKEDEFWSLISEARRGADGHEQQVDNLIALLTKLPAIEIQVFDNYFGTKLEIAYRWDLWLAGLLINGLCSDDGFEYFRCWLIAQGREVFEAALENPDSLASAISPEECDAECEELLYAAYNAYESVTGEGMPLRSSTGPRKPKGAPIKEEEIGTRFPCLTKICW